MMMMTMMMMMIMIIKIILSAEVVISAFRVKSFDSTNRVKFSQNSVDPDQTVYNKPYYQTCTRFLPCIGLSVFFSQTKDLFHFENGIVHLGR